MARVTTWDGKVYDVPNENVNAFLEQYNADTNYALQNPNPNINPDRGANLGGVVRAGLQGVPVVGSYSDEAEASVRAAGDALLQEMMYQQEHRNDPKPEPQFPGLAGQLMQGVQNFQDTQKRYSEAYDKSYDKYLKNARESFEGALKNAPEYAWPAYIGTGLIGEGALAYFTGGASLHPAVQGLMGAAYGYGMGEGAGNRAIDAGIVGTASATLPIAGRYVVRPAGKAIATAGGNILTNIGNKILKKKIPNTIEALGKTATADKLLYKNSNGELAVNTLSSLMNGAGDYATQAKVATELVKETPKNAGLYNSGIMKTANELANIGWKDQVTGAISDVAAKIENVADKKILTKMADKLSKATRTVIESADNALEEIEFKDVRDVVNYAVKQFGKKLSDNTKSLLEKRLISEGMAKRISNKLVNKPLAESAKKSVVTEAGKDLALTLVGNAVFPGAGPIAAIGRNIVRGGTASASKKALENRAAGKAAEVLTNNAIQLTEKDTNQMVGHALAGGQIEAPTIVKKLSSRPTFFEAAEITKPQLNAYKKAWENRPTPNSIIDVLKGGYKGIKRYYKNPKFWYRPAAEEAVLDEQLGQPFYE